ncbi:glycosyltransferase [Polynucleobacter sp. MWH-UH24A]|uniref:glycosyltransferase n=1 Tax=Polynucleobacter sp. MWH-UH24A TaxID=2689110 RepID=UPI00203E4392|nr:glycosyltransferase [Polynucleobacter sp. MWH-UH24A]
MNIISIVVGFDQKEAVAYHVFCQSIIEKASLPCEFLPLAENTLSEYKETHKDGSNKFIYSRFLTPYLKKFTGWAIFADGDMICNVDIKELWEKRDPTKAVQVVKHNYKTKRNIKYLGNKNEDYPRKNWSSLILWNCEHPKNRILMPQFIQSQPGSYLHRFSWLDDDEIGELNKDWNWLAIEYPDSESAKLIHYTLGTPCFFEFRDTEMSEKWINQYQKTIEGMEK